MAQGIFAFIFTLAVMGLWLVLIGWTVKSIVMWRRDLRKPISEVSAIVSRCFEEEDYVYQFADKVVATHNVVFKQEDGKELVFCLAPHEYRDFHEGDAGILRLRDGVFVSFESQTDTGQRIHAHGTNADQVYKRLIKGK